MKKDYIATFTTEFLILGVGLAVYKLAAVRFGIEGFSEYALSRRTISMVQPMLILGLGVGIPRYLAYRTADSETDSSDSYYAVGVLFLLFAAVLSFTLLNHFKCFFSGLFFGDQAHSHLIWPIALTLSGALVHAACYSFFRGKIQMGKANGLQVQNLAVMPLVSFWFGSTPADVMTVNAYGILLVSISTLVCIWSRLKYQKRLLFSCGHTLLSYGVQRLPGDFGLAALMALPATLTAHAAGVTKAGQVAFAISLLSMAGAVFSPLGIMMLPRVSLLRSLQKHNDVVTIVTNIQQVTLGLSLFGTIVFLFFARQLIGIFMKNPADDIVDISRIMMLSALGYCYYVSLRSVIDAYYHKAYVTVNIIISLIVFVVLTGTLLLLQSHYSNILYAFVIAIMLLGFTTRMTVRKIMMDVPCEIVRDK